MKKSMKIKIIGFIIMLLFIAGALSASTYAWFAVGRIATVDPYQINVSATGNLKIAPGDVTDVNSSLFMTVLDFGNIDNFNKSEVSSDGNTFVKPTDLTNTDFVNANPTSDYISKDFTVLFDEPKFLFLSGESFIEDVTGTLSKAARIAIYEYVDPNPDPELRFVWAPNTEQFVSGSGLVNFVKPNGDNTYDENATYTAIKSGLPTVSTSDEIPLCGDISDEPGYISTFNTTSGTKTSVRIKIVIWVDGSDPDSKASSLDSETDKARWKANLNFSAFTAGVCP